MTSTESRAQIRSTTLTLRRATTFERCRNCDCRIAELNHQALDVTLPSGHVLTLCAFCAGDDLMAHARRLAS